MTIKQRKIEKVKELYNEGLNTAQIGRIVGVTSATIQAWLKDEGVYRYDHFTSMDTVESIREMYLDEGMTSLQIANELGLKQSKVRNILSRNNIHRVKREKYAYSCPDVKIDTIDDPIFYVEHQPTNEKVTYSNKNYRDVSAMLLGG